MKTSTKLPIGANFVHSSTPKEKLVFTSRPNSLLESLKEVDNQGVTENGAPTMKSSLSAIVDLFAMGAALRTRADSEVEQLFIKAFAEDSLLALKLAFHIRNIRGGGGERKTFRTILKWLGNNYTSIVVKNLDNVVKHGRYDDLFVLFDTKAEHLTLDYIATQLHKDVEAYNNDKQISLLGKWSPSMNTSSAVTRALGSKVCKFLGWTPKQYRKTLSALRAYSNVLEVKLSANEWGDVDYSHIPSKAGLKYRKAFFKHDKDRYETFVADVKSGKKTVNAGVLFPYEIVHQILYKGAKDETLDILWDALPNYMGENNRNILILADVSGSMQGRPMATSIALAIYAASLNKGSFAGYFITYSEKPQLQKIVGNNIREKIACVQKIAAVNTNLQATFDLLLDTAIKNNIKPEDMPSQIICVTDAEFDSPQNKGKTNHQTLVEKYGTAGYEVPVLVYWNVSSRQNNVSAKADEKGVILCSGSSPSVFKSLLSGASCTPLTQVLETLNGEMYNSVVI